MSTLTELRKELTEEKQETANRQKRIKTRINQELKAEAYLYLLTISRLYFLEYLNCFY